MRNITLRLVLIIFFTLLLSLSEVSIAADIIEANQSISDGQTLVSAGETFELGFFSPGDSRNRYLGIWYKKVAEPTYVWVANRENPLNDSSGVFRIDDQGSLMILNGRGGVIWSSNQTNAEHPEVQLLDTGNLVVREEGDKETFLWQSFDYPSDTLLPGMKLGSDFRNHFNWSLTSWKSASDPSHGDYSFTIDPHGFPQSFLLYRSVLAYRGGPWNGIYYTPRRDPNFISRFNLVFNQDEVYYRYELVNNTIISRLVLNLTGELQRRTWVSRRGGTGYWHLYWQTPDDQCDDYSECGPYGVCNGDNAQICSCVKGFKPKSPGDWNVRVYTGGCVRQMPLDCRKDGFLRLERMKLPDSSNSFVGMNMTIKECRDMCLRNCSCTAYSSGHRERETGCIIWLKELVDLRQFTLHDSGKDLYVRIDSSELGKGNKKKLLAIIVSVSTISTMLLFGSIWCYLWWKNKKWNSAEKRKGNTRKSQELPFFDMVGSYPGITDISTESRKDELELPLFDLATVSVATDNLSLANKLGEGGFGPVYKGKLANGQEIAVKRLSEYSGQGIAEFMNEVSVIAKLQHRNLVRLLGCCTQGEEKMLIYEYMKNGSLDSILFDEKKSTSMNWPTRFNIIMGIARGLLYLHQDSRLRIIHRDLKASNILLDDKMNPKISDFGTARIFGGDQTDAKTKRVIGTYGYMSPEYAMNGHFSDKSDVFSFGVLVLEIVSGQRSKGVFGTEDDHNLLGHTWGLWNKDISLELMDPSLAASCYNTSEMLRCIHVALLCVQERSEDRPTMSVVVLMLGSENAALPQPKQPGFVAGRSLTVTGSSKQDSCTISSVTVTTLEAR